MASRRRPREDGVPPTRSARIMQRREAAYGGLGIAAASHVIRRKTSSPSWSLTIKDLLIEQIAQAAANDSLESDFIFVELKSTRAAKHQEVATDPE